MTKESEGEKADARQDSASCLIAMEDLEAAATDVKLNVNALTQFRTIGKGADDDVRVTIFLIFVVHSRH